MIDGSHNIQGFESLHETMRATFPERPLIWVASLRNNREPGMMMDLITQQPNTQAIVWTQGQHPGWYHLPSELAEHWQSMASQKMPHVNVKTAEFIGEALASARQRFAEVSAQSQATPLIVVTGSLYVAGEALNVLGLGPQSSPRFVSGKDA